MKTSMFIFTPFLLYFSTPFHAVQNNIFDLINSAIKAKNYVESLIESKKVWGEILLATQTGYDIDLRIIIQAIVIQTNNDDYAIFLRRFHRRKIRPEHS
ncbi:MAG: hypothetical protein WBA74_27815 [Cyclobacteriaceae bacterium]